jgi:hypothetical protein
MATLTVNILSYGEVVCRSFYDIDLGYGGVEIKIDGELLGTMLEELPDEYEDDEDEVSNFADKVELWLIENGH